MALPIGLQLYTIRDCLSKDYEGSLKQVARIGYEYVEWAGMYGRSAAQARQVVDKLGLKSCNTHLGLEAFTTQLDQTIADAKVLGFKFITCPWIDGKYHNPEGFRQVAKTLTEAGKKAADHGLYVCYHNHSFEFNKLADGSIGMDILFGESDPKYVGSELDLYWVWHGGQFPSDWMKKLAGRVPLLHIKDMARRPDRRMIEVGNGILDMADYVKLAPECKAEFLLVEQDTGWVDNDPLKSIAISYQNLKKMNGGKGKPRAEKSRSAGQ